MSNVKVQMPNQIQSSNFKSPHPSFAKGGATGGLLIDFEL
jgi:hypothetical protein